MNLMSFSFVIFCVITFLLYYIVPKKFQWIILLVMSTFFLFYKNLSINTILQAALIAFVAYIFGLLIDKNSNKKSSAVYLTIGIIIILLELIYLKYTNLFLITFNHIFSLLKINYKFNMVYRNSLIGISYYSLMMIGYLVDIYRGSCKSQKNIFKLFLFLSYFPILTSGPIIKYRDIKNEIYEKHKFSYNNFCKGMIRIFWGIFKILVISQRINYFVNTIYSDIVNFDGFFIILAILFYPLELYTNFSGSIDVIMGISEIFGIKLPENFDKPFFSKTITEFWRRWHITLGNWLKEYIFYPLQKSIFIQNLGKRCNSLFGKKIGKKIPLYFTMLIMWILIGAWHGGVYTIIISSGLLQFIYMIFEDLLEPIVMKINKKIGINTNVFSYKLYQIIRTYVLFSFSMIFFSSNSISNAINIIKKISIYNPWVLLDNHSIYTAGLDMQDFNVLIIALIVMFIVELLSFRCDVRESLFKQNIFFRWGIIYLLMFSIIIFGCYGVGYDPAAFIYQNF